MATKKPVRSKQKNLTFGSKRRPWQKAALFIIPFAVIGGYVILKSFASSFTSGITSCATKTCTVSADTPCIHANAPSKWNHVILIMFENKQYSDVIGSSSAPFLTSLAQKCGTAYSGSSGATPTNNWHDSDYKVDGTKDSTYNSKPSYALLTNGLPGSQSGITSDTYAVKSGVDNIYREAINRGISVKDYFDDHAGGTGCSDTSWSGNYHDPIRYYTDITAAECNAHDVNLNTFGTDLNNGTLPAFSVILPTNDENMHNNTIASGDSWAQFTLTLIMNSNQYKTGDTAIFMLWDEDTPIPNVLIAPSIAKGSKVPAPAGNPISHYAALRTFEEMLGLPYIGNSGAAPSLLSFFNGK